MISNDSMGGSDCEFVQSPERLRGQASRRWLSSEAYRNQETRFEEVGSELRVTLMGPGERFMEEVVVRPAWAEGLNERQVEAVLYAIEIAATFAKSAVADWGWMETCGGRHLVFNCHTIQISRLWATWQALVQFQLRQDWPMQIWQLLTLELWMETFMD